ncbi:NADH dehydrogenase subunit 4L [Herbaspirillum sp. ST 5-3]|uniref:NADH-quinone oxidoreductase subunit K n=1 Tax=Herbaspirillum sp. ST 5-3 TaxID=2567936 RepID=UPI0010A52C10
MVLFGIILFIFGIFSLVYNRKHMLALLLSLEIVMLGVFLILAIFVASSIVELIVFYFVLVVCEARLGLGVLVIGVYFYGSDELRGISLLRC